MTFEGESIVCSLFDARNRFSFYTLSLQYSLSLSLTHSLLTLDVDYYAADLSYSSVNVSMRSKEEEKILIGQFWSF